MTGHSYDIGTATTAEILPLRMAVLRDGTPSRDPRYAEDNHDTTLHLVTRDADGIIVGSEELDAETLALLDQAVVPVMRFPGEEGYVSEINAYYDTILEGKTEAVAE